MRRTPFGRAALPAGLAAAVLLLAGLPAAAPSSPAKRDTRRAAGEEKTLAAALKKATVNGKYRMLLRQLKVPGDRETYTDFHDYGRYSGTDYAGHKDLPPGYWVYVAPSWYIWRDLAGTPMPKRGWGPEQATGPPDTQRAGDHPTAWASRTEDSQDEWLLLEYAEPVTPKEILVHETYNPGAISRVTAFKLDGTEVEVWKGKDPSAGKEIGVSVLPFKESFRTNRIKLFIASSKVPGWNEIDAVGLKTAQGKTCWAVAAHASSTYAEPARPADPRDQRIRQLEKEVRELKATLRRLEALLEKQEKKDR